MNISGVFGFLIYLIIMGITIAAITLFSIFAIDIVMTYMPAQRRERELQRHAAVLQQATRRKLSTRRPVSPCRYRYSKPTKSATLTNYHSD